MARFQIISTLVACSTALLAAAAPAATFTVNSTANAGPGTFRQAILDANANPGPDVIDFAITGCPGAPPVCTIAPTSGLPSLLDTVTIDGYANGMGTPNTLGPGLGTNAVLGVELDLSGNLGCLDFRAGGALRGLVVNRSPTTLVCVQGPPLSIQGNFIGTNASGTAAGPGAPSVGIAIVSDANVVGGTQPADRNLISGNSDGVVINGQPLAFPNTGRSNVIQGNLIGTNAAGTAVIPGGSNGVVVAMDSSSSRGRQNTIGGSTPAARNVIAGQAQVGVLLRGGSLAAPGANLVQGNFIGTDAAGTAALPNDTGVATSDFNGGNTIGGSSLAEANVIAGNTTRGVLLGTPDNVLRFNFVGTTLGATAPLANGAGVQVDVGDDNLVADNVIATNGTVGVVVGSLDPATTGTSILGNSIHGNGTRGIDLIGSANGAQSAPALTTASIAGGTLTVSGTLASTASASFQVQVFVNATCDASGSGEGQTHVGDVAVTTDGSGNGSFGPVSFGVPPGQTVVTATATGDATGNTSEFSACLTATGGPVNRPPVSVGDAYATPRNVALLVAAPGVLANDSDPDLDALTAVLDSPPADGTLALSANGGFTYTPNPGFAGLDSFTYHASDGVASGNVVTVSLDVQDVAAAAEIPTLGGWGLLLLSATIALAGARRLWSR